MMILRKLTNMIFASAAISAVSSLATVIMMNSAYAAELTINVNEIEGNDGYILVALFSGEESYTSGKSKWSSRVKVANNQEKVTFSALPDGEYAVKLFHDENDNKKLDMNMLGIPSESYGFSNNKGRFGQPSYQEAKFTVTNTTDIEINLM